MKKHRTLLILLLAVLLVVGIATGIVLSEYHHLQVKQALIAAVKADDTKTAFASLNAGGDADYPQNENAPRPVWIQWLDRMTGLKVPSKEIGPSLLAQAVQHNNTLLVKALLEKGATDVQGLIVSRYGRDSPEEPIPLLSAAADAGNLTICQALVAHGADVNLGESFCALKMAARGGHSAVILFLFHQGAKLDEPDGMDGYSLMEAAYSGDAESVRLLLAHGANANYEERWGSILSDAVNGGHLAVVKLVVEAGADADGGGAYSSALQDAAEVGDVEIVRYLLKKGANVNREVRWNRTPLIEAVKGNHTAVVKLLLEHGADWRPKVEVDGMDFTQGDTALRWAELTGNKEIIRLLKQAGAKK